MEMEAALPRKRSITTIVGLMLLILALAGLFYYKWGGSVRTLDKVRVAGEWTASADALKTGNVLQVTLYYFSKVWLALLFGILIGAVVRAFVSPKWVASLLAGGGAARRQVAGGLAGAPLMLCSCCVTPIFTSVYERGARLGSSIAVMLASPGLNVAALILTFLLFPLDLSLARLGAALVAVFVLPALLERLFGRSVPPPPIPEDEPEPRTLRDYAWRFARSLAHITVVTVPLIAIGVALSSVLLPLGLSASHAGAFVMLLAVAAIGVAVAVPTFFEIPLALILLEMGSPGAAAGMLFAGPIINLPSLFVLAKHTNAKVAASLAAGIWLLAVAAGVAVTL